MVSNSSLIRDEEGNIVEAIGVAHDITEMREILESLERANEELRAAQAQLVQSEKMASLGQLVAGIAHEINTPIGAVNSMHDTQLRAFGKLKAILEGETEIQSLDSIKAALKVIDDANRVIKSGTERVTTIVRRLRSFARLDEAELKMVDIHEGLEDTLTLVHHEIKHHIEIERDYAGIPPIACYPGKLNQVFLNMLNNARQAIVDQGEIRIKTEHSRGKVMISFSDTGVGIPPNKLKKVFDPGYTTKGVGIGTGLGLSICYQIIKDHRGEILVDSEVGKGTTFTIVLPDNLDKLLGVILQD
jgi:signal transduction histidine kinase